MREAVQSLAAVNILDVRHGAGIFVSSLGIHELLSPMRFALELGGPTVAQLFEVRLTLEPRAAELAAERASDEQVAAIEDCVRRHGRRGLTRRELLELDTELPPADRGGLRERAACEFGREPRSAAAS